jgi:hypothetical protein
VSQLSFYFSFRPPWLLGPATDPINQDKDPRKLLFVRLCIILRRNTYINATEPLLARPDLISPLPALLRWPPLVLPLLQPLQLERPPVPSMRLSQPRGAPRGKYRTARNAIDPEQDTHARVALMPTHPLLPKWRSTLSMRLNLCIFNRRT